MRVVVIGGAGYIGSHVVRGLLDSGHVVRVFDNLSFGLRENLFPQAEFVHGDIMDELALGRALEGWEAVVHLAAFKAVGESMVKPEKYARNNICGTVNILNAMSAHGLKRIVFSSSAAVFGEPSRLPIDEDHPTAPESFYGFTKLEIERILAWYSRLKGLRFSALRYFNAAGYDPEGRIMGLEREPNNLIPRLMEVAVGLKPGIDIFGDDYDTPDGTCVRDYVHVSDLARAHVMALDYMESRDADLRLNLGTGRGASVMEILEASRRVSGKAIPARIVGRRPGDPARLYASSARAKDVLGWEPLHSDIDTLVRTSWKAYSFHYPSP